jgi:hypothetical protein
MRQVRAQFHSIYLLLHAMSTWADEYLTLLDDCEKRSEKLTAWECGFVDSLQRQLADGRRPSAKQVETLDRIWERATARG